MILRKLFWVLPAAVLSFAVSCSSGDSNVTAADAAAPTSAASVSPARAEFITASGPIVVENQVDVMAQRSGIVAKLLADTGTPVKTGQLLATLDDRQLKADTAAAEAKARSIEADVKNWESELKVREVDLQRSEEMWKAQLITQQQVEHDRYSVTATRYEVERERENFRHSQEVLASLKLELEKTQIRAPFNGIVARRYVHEGERVAEGGRLFWVSATGPLRVRFTLPEKWVYAVKRGDMIEVSSVPDFGQKHAAKVQQISPVVDPSSGTFEIMAELTGSPQDLKPGMTANIRLRNPQ